MLLETTNKHSTYSGLHIKGKLMPFWIILFVSSEIDTHVFERNEDKSEHMQGRATHGENPFFSALKFLYIHIPGDPDH